MSRWTKEEIQAVWEKGTKVRGINADMYRKDQCDAWMKRDEYGNREHDEGWEIDHVTTISKGGTDELSNLRPLQWANNAGRSDGRLTTIVTSDGSFNVYKDDEVA
ncbi:MULTISPECIES: HNH endonuclease signature motif containing protein [Pectobacterium]|uniref:HNH endonuclease signature motif containing protein n=1 Tax=Pectobacterium TaxID=122277 RepID=UPI000D19FBC1|nr:MULTISPECIES: HNH endonuclease signature motif containing protein [Pectobacterium]AVT59199.1 hypothetical protein OA04_26580 [Pectobacterium versatile]MCA6962432.1 HNH endonuclease [Pectobacterium odoriferum]MCH5010528.1 HNH endonuclease [Pectobacterium odoriferum]